MAYCSVIASKHFQFWLITICSILILCLLIFMLLWVQNRRRKQRGIVGERKVARVLRRFARKRRAVLINSLYLPLYDGCTEIDHLLCGSFGVIVVETKNIGGTISGGGEYLIQQIGGKSHKLHHPQKQNETHIRNVEHHLRKAGLNDVPVRGYVVFSNPKVVLKTKAGLTLSELATALQKLPNGHCNGKKIERALRAVQVRSPFRKLWHDLKLHRAKRT